MHFFPFGEGALVRSEQGPTDRAAPKRAAKGAPAPAAEGPSQSSLLGGTGLVASRSRSTLNGRRSIVTRLIIPCTTSPGPPSRGPVRIDARLVFYSLVSVLSSSWGHGMSVCMVGSQNYTPWLTQEHGQDALERHCLEIACDASRRL